MATMIFSGTDRDEAHQFLADKLASEPGSKAECREDHNLASPYMVWDGPNTDANMEAQQAAAEKIVADARAEADRIIAAGRASVDAIANADKVDLAAFEQVRAARLAELKQLEADIEAKRAQQ